MHVNWFWTLLKSPRIVIDENMASQSHVDKPDKKIASGIGAMKRIGPFVSPDIPHSLYNALIQPFTTCGDCNANSPQEMCVAQCREYTLLISGFQKFKARF